MANQCARICERTNGFFQEKRCASRALDQVTPKGGKLAAVAEQRLQQLLRAFGAETVHVQLGKIALARPCVPILGSMGHEKHHA